MSAASVAAERLRVAPGALARRLERVRPVPGLAVLVALQLAQAAWFAVETPHNGWIWYSGGDATSYWTEAWSLGHLIMPPAAIGYGLPVYYAWAPLVAGPSLVTGLGVITMLQVVVLVPLALVLFWLVAGRLFGRVYAWVAAALWVAAPLLMLHGFVPGYHWVFDQLFLAPYWFGLTNMADLPSMVAVLACAWLTLRALDTADPTDYVLGGLLAGVAIGLKPANALFLPAVAVLLIGSRRPRHVAAWIAGIVPAVITLAVWKWRGLGYLPLTSSSYQHLRVAAGASIPLAFSTHRYLPLDVHHLHGELLDLREEFWSLRFLEFLVVAGLFGVIRKAPLKGLFILIWFGMFCVVKASSQSSSIAAGNFYRLAEPGLPACILIVVGVGYCVPRLGRRVAALGPGAERPFRLGDLDRRRLVPAVIVCALAPLALVLAARTPSTVRTVRDENRVQEAPISGDLHVSATREPGGTVRVTWRTPSVGSTVPSFLVFASSDGNGCDPLPRGARHCKFNTMPTVETTRSNSFVEHVPSSKRRWYRVALVADYRPQTVGGDLMLMSRAVFVPAAHT